jgi:hypothetical protein
MKTAFMLLGMLTEEAMNALIIGLIVLAIAAFFACITATGTMTGGLFISAHAVHLATEWCVGSAAIRFVGGTLLSALGVYKLQKSGILGLAAEKNWQNFKDFFSFKKGEDISPEAV